MVKKKPYTPEEIVDQPFPVQDPAKSVSSPFFNTKSRQIHTIFKFSEKGGIQIGDYKEGVAGYILLDLDGFHGYDTSGVERVKVRQSGGIDFRGSNVIRFLASDSDDVYGLFGVQEGVGGLAGINLTTNYWLGLSAGESIACHSDLEVGTFTYPTPGWVAKFSVDYLTGDTYIAGDLTVDGTFSITGGFVIDGDLEVTGDLTVAGALNATVDEADYASAAGSLVDVLDPDNIIVGYTSGSDIKFFDGVNLKTAIVPTSKGYRALYCTESPEVWFMDFCYGRKKKKWPKFWEKEWETKPSKLFMETTSPPYIVIPTVLKNVVQIWGKRKGYEKKRFEEKTKKQFEKNNEFWNTPNK